MPPPDKKHLPRLKTPSPPPRQRPSSLFIFLYTAVSSHCLAAEGIKGNVSNKPSESVATSLRFLSQPGSFAPVVFNSHSQALGDKNLPDPPMELKEATKIEEVPGFSTDSGIEAVSSESSRHVAPISGTEVTFRAFSNLGLSSSPDKVQEKTSDASPAMKVQERSQGVFSRGQTPEEPKVQGKPAADSETWGDGGFMLFKECHYERSPVKESTEPFSLFNKDPSPDQDSPDSPFEVLDNSQRKHSFGKEFLETMTSDWVPTQIAAAKVVSDVEQAKDEKDQGPFGPLADIHNIEVTTKLEKTDWAKEPAYKSMQKEAKEDFDESRDSTPELDEEEKKISPVSGGKTAPPPPPPPLPPSQAKPIDTQVEEIKKQASPAKESSGEDLNFLPTAYIWEKPEKDAEKTQQTLEKSCADFENLPPAYTEVGTATATSSSSSPPSYASFKFDTEELLKSQQPATAKVPGLIWGVDSEPVENIDADSSGESDDTVIEDVSVVTEREPAVPKSTATVKDPEEMKQEVAPAKLEKPLLVPIINVIETEEQIVSDDESDEQASAVVLEPAERAGNDSTTPPADTTPQDSKLAGPVLGKEDSQPMAVESETEKPKQDSEPVLDDSEIKSLTQDSESIFADSVMETQDPKPVLADPKIEKPSSVLADFAKEKPTQDQKLILFDPETKKSTQDSQTSLEDSIMGKPTQDPKPILFDSETKISTQDSKTIFTDSIMEKPTQDPKPILFDSKIEKPFSTGESLLRGGAVKADAYEKAFQDLEEMEKEDPTKRIQTVLHTETVEAQPTSIDVSQVPFHYAQDVPTNTTSTATTVQTKAEEPVVTSEEAAKHLPKISFPSRKSEDLLPRAGPPDQSPAQSITPAIPKEMASRGGAEITMPVFKEEPSCAEDSPDSTSDPESIEPECSVSAATDSFVDFMRECLKSRQDESPEDLSHDFIANVSTTAAVAGSRPPQAAPTMVLDFEQEQLTIKALKELGESLEEEEEEEVEARNSPASKPGAQKLLLSSQAAPESFSKQQTASSPIRSHPEVAEISPSGAPREVEEASTDDNQRAAAAAALAEHALAALLTQASVRELIYWRDVKMSGTVFGVTLLLLLSLAAFSVVSVLSYLLLALLVVTISFRVFKSVVQAVQKSDEGHPFRAYMEKDISLSSESFSRYVDTGLRHGNCVLKQLSRLFLVEDLVDSLKLAVFMWLMTYVGAVFNGITLLIIAHILVFSIPVVYEKYKTPIDRYVGIVHNQVKSVVSKVQAKVPGLSKRKPE
ncbi:reticulon-4 isoform X1 [Huso huso]|uniref:Reticulon n=1 Tax=Huso huso TaxID=61971 RepID=A0ABR0Y187_HUSHU